MKLKKEKRSYKMSARADLVAQNEQRILQATADLWLKLPFSDITLEKVAEISGVTVRTILRKFGSKEGLFEACIENDAGNFQQNRNQAPLGNLPEIMSALLAEYEIMGDAVIRTLAEENKYPFAKKLLDRGRVHHRKWCAKAFQVYLPDPAAEEYEMLLLSFISATEIYLWKLMRRDLGQSFEQTQQIFLLLIEGLVQNITNKFPN